MTTYGETEFRASGERPVCLLAAVFRAADVRTVAGYNVQLGVSNTAIGGVEDVEIFNRLFRAGKYGLYAPNVYVYHKVESERLTKSYHRRWHTGHGRQITRLHDPAVEQSRRRILDVPAHVYSTAVTVAFDWTRHIATGNVTAAFYDETQVRIPVVAMQPTAEPGLEEQYAGAFREWIAEPAAREAWDELELQHELKLSFEEGWTREVWQPHVLLIFPGRFESERWRRVLRCMRTVIGSLEPGGGRAAHSET